MGRSKPVDLGEKHFATTTEAKTFFSEIVNEAKSQGTLPKVIADEEQNRILEALLDTKADALNKIGEGLDYFFVDYVIKHPDPIAKHPTRKDAVAIFIKRTDGDVMDFGIPGALDNYGKNPQLIQKAEVKAALRNAIEPDRQKLRQEAFEDAEEVICPRTGFRMTNFHQARVINVSPSWGDLTSDFVATVGGWDAIELSVDSDSIQHGKRLSDTSIELKWIEYWKKNSNPIICARIE
ncbi:MAG: DUF3223 domain-containing protein [Bifidobacterium sp.]|uniref:DUF3223 domain-containing protein n=1 Tax=Bifidobacterium fermentum TaxID=3059035 RepID=A0AB39UHC8_9BIFI